jgi:hypothetical protein
MSTHYHAVVWIDHHSARIYRINASETDRIVIHPDNPVRHLHHRSGSRTGAKASEDQGFYQEVAEALGDAGEILVTGPANAKLELVKHLARSAPAVLERVVGIETVDHPSDGVLVDHARRIFKAADRMRPQIG